MKYSSSFHSKHEVSFFQFFSRHSFFISRVASSHVYILFKSTIMFTGANGSLLPLALILSSSLANSAALQKRYDLDGNGTPDLCYTGSSTAHCLLGDGSWTAFPATETGFRLTTASATKQVVSTTSSTTSTASALPTGSLPSPSQFATDKGTKWSVTYEGDLKFTGKMQTDNLGGDKCRSSKIGDKVIWNCGDMECGGDWTICGFNMGPAFYGTSDVMTVNTTGVDNIADNNFVSAWSGDPTPVAPQTSWGMDTSNVAAINSTHGIAYAWEIWRGASDNSIVDRGNAVIAVTLGETKPIATRVGPLLTGPDVIQMGLLAILRADNYIYTYSIGGPSNIIVGRVAADDSAFTASKYEFLTHGSSDSWTTGVPSSNTTAVGATTANTSGQFGCAVYGSVFYSNYLKQYVIICNIYLSYVNMYTSDTPYGPWSAEYSLMSASTDDHVSGSYGSMVHHEYAPGGSDKEVYFSMGPNSVFNMFKIQFNY